MAAGLSIAVENISKFREDLSRSVSVMSTNLALEKTIGIDAYLSFHSINENLLMETEQLAPFGPGNPPAVLVSRNLEIENASFIGKSREHRKLVVKDQVGNSHNAIWWGSADINLPEGLFDLAFYLRRDDFRSKGDAARVAGFQGSRFGYHRDVK
jgi:single-stranded-DNA-specific exonuclease